MGTDLEEQALDMPNPEFKIMKKVNYGKQDEVVPATWLPAD